MATKGILKQKLEDSGDSQEPLKYTLSQAEKTELSLISGDTDVITEAQNMKFDVLLKDGSTIRASGAVLARVIGAKVRLASGKNYRQRLKTANITILYDGERKKIDNKQFARGSELMALLQIATGKGLTPDGKFGPASAAGFAEFWSEAKPSNAKKPKPTSPETKEKELDDISLSNLTEHNFSNDFVTLFGKSLLHTYETGYNLFHTGKNLDAGKFVSCTVFDGKVTIGYKSKYVKNRQFISLPIDTKIYDNATKNIKVEPFLKGVKNKIDANEVKRKKESMQKNIETGVDDVEVTNFHPLIQEYLEAQGRTLGGTLNFESGFGTGMVVDEDKNTLKVTYPGKGRGGKDLVKTYKLSTLQKNNKLNTTNFVTELSGTLFPWAKEWKRGGLEASKKLVLNANYNANTEYSLNNKITRLTKVEKEIDDALRQGVVVDKKEIIEEKTKLENQKKYIKAKKRLGNRIKDLENKNNKKVSRAEMLNLTEKIKKTYNALNTVEDMKLGNKIIKDIKTAFVTVGKEKEYNAYKTRCGDLLGLK